MEYKLPSRNPKLMISEYFDSLIRQVDIYTEETLQRYTDAQIFEFEPFESIVRKEHTSKCTDTDPNSRDMNNSSDLEWNEIRKSDKINVRDNLNEWGQEPIKTVAYVNQMRDELIAELEKGQKEVFEYFETVKDKIKKNMSEEDKRSIVFATNYYFTLTEIKKDKIPFKMHLVKLDFYLNRRERDVLRYFLTKDEFILNGKDDNQSCLEHIESNNVINQECLLAFNLAIYLYKLFFNDNNHYRFVRTLIRIAKKSQLAAIHTIKNFTENVISENDNLILDLCKPLNEKEAHNYKDKYDFLNIKTFYCKHIQCDVYLENLSLLTGLENLNIDQHGHTLSSNISESFFPSLSKSLRRLKLDGANFGNLNENCLSSLTELRTLDMSMCFEWDHIDLNVLPRLECLVITTSYELQHLYEHSFENLLKFKHENLVVMEIEFFENFNFDRDWLSGFPSLKRLKIYRQKYSNPEEKVNLPDVTALANSLEWLHLCTCELVRLDEFCSKPLVNLKHLDLSFNRIKMRIPGAFIGFDQLAYLNISANKIQAIHSEAFRGLKCLERLDLSHNQIKSLSHEVFTHLSHLKNLNLSRNEITWDDNRSIFVHLRRLETLNMSSNRLYNSKPTEGFFTGLDCLEELNLSSNRLTQIDAGIFKGLSNLKRLDLSENSFRDLPLDLFTFTPNLEEVNLKYTFMYEKAQKIKMKFTNLRIQLQI